MSLEWETAIARAFNALAGLERWAGTMKWKVARGTVDLHTRRVGFAFMAEVLKSTLPIMWIDHVNERESMEIEAQLLQQMFEDIR